MARILDIEAIKCVEKYLEETDNYSLEGFLLDNYELKRDKKEIKKYLIDVLY
jgi:hypothetical protein